MTLRKTAFRWLHEAANWQLPEFRAVLRAPLGRPSTKCERMSAQPRALPVSACPRDVARPCRFDVRPSLRGSADDERNESSRRGHGRQRPRGRRGGWPRIHDRRDIERRTGARHVGPAHLVRSRPAELWGRELRRRRPYIFNSARVILGVGLRNTSARLHRNGGDQTTRGASVLLPARNRHCGHDRAGLPGSWSRRLRVAVSAAPTRHGPSSGRGGALLFILHIRRARWGQLSDANSQPFSVTRLRTGTSPLSRSSSARSFGDGTR